MTIDFAYQARMFFGLYERELAAHLRRLAAPGMRAFDVGADVGYYSLALARLLKGPVMAFDPNPDALARIEADAARNGFDIRTRRTTVGDAEGDGTVTLDSVAAASFVPDLIKMDIEGCEVAALRGARRLLAERKPHLIIEVHGEDLEIACHDLLRGHGYQPLPIRPRRLFPEERPDPGNAWLVCAGRAP